MNLAEEISQDGFLSKKVKGLIFIALAINNRCNHCIAHHVNDALQAGASKEEIYEAAQVAVVMGGGPSMAYTATVLNNALESFKF
jgi:AhpD family alkylhydroperoxidase